MNKLGFRLTAQWCLLLWLIRPRSSDYRISFHFIVVRSNFRAARLGVRRADDMHLTLEFGGGLELLFGSQKKHEVEVTSPDDLKEVTMESLLSWIKDNLIKERPEMFVKESSVRPGVLVLINDSDWELCGRLETVLEENDEVIFISTLHGG
uniref:Ubiquitin-related modifier 1 homolog n=2 Tax=Physcomitrium patens TaxID=3218 RepID=A0A2K1JCU0_PHYPA|nr:hypothetical protein PHYPA_019607 [Physcomitrium patens]